MLISKRKFIKLASLSFPLFIVSKPALSTFSTSAIKPISLMEKLADITEFGALSGDYDNYSIIQGLLNEGRDVYIPNGVFTISNSLVVKKNNQKIYGVGTLKITENNSMDVVVCNERTGFDMRGISVSAGGKQSGIYKTCCVKLIKSNAFSISKCSFTNYIGGGVQLLNCNDGNISFNSFMEAADAKESFSSSVDICFYNGGANNTIYGNKCFGYGGYGIVFQTLADSVRSTFINNTISYNNIAEHSSYGILIYRGGAQSLFKNNSISHNIVSGISGSNINRAKDNFSFGAGIYIQGAEHSFIDNNHISKCNTLTKDEMLAPGAIGVANASYVIISNNIIKDSSFYGIYINDSNHLADPSGVVEIKNNEVTNSNRDAIKINESSNVLIYKNNVSGAKNGVVVTQKIGENINGMKSIEIEGNSIKNIRGNAINISNLKFFKITNNNTVNNGRYSVNIIDSSSGKIEGNQFKSDGRSPSFINIERSEEIEKYNNVFL
ncbi:parallel beta helix pectate lyase-like protein [Serratia fonticola]|jgi:hypothetical protein|uniref:Parallel beta helix pectate lyase-like protein n=1 Tax=Serratia fonticola TaxID=47917 RepID=A0A542D4Z6_SERFO|nr:right-handed parallel beta-helix repeat-containing protein [Serratia fonticola]TQI79818.1 parallel beta helix pectate lyase-like protein [Serratia fonticola]TQI98157.1 parallel beta helix pectate lyase-like protein [Serratia fonticola]TVZ67685.1 parallel beta helix pectate lyase-like protein [Serratia fonticola]